MKKVPPKFTFRNKPADEMILAAYVEPLCYGENIQNFDVTPDEAYDDVKRANLNTIIATEKNCYIQDPHPHEILSHASKRRMNVFIKDLGITNGRNELVQRTEEGHYEYFRDAYKPLEEKYSAFAGLHFIDEPGYKYWEEYAPIQRAFKKALPNKVFFLNLLQTYAPHWAFPNGPFYTPEAEDWLPDDPDIDKYYSSYMDIVKPELFSYDHYPIKNAFPEVEPDYFRQLHLSYKYAEQANIPIFAFIQVGAWGDRARIPSEDELRYQVNCALAYNTKHLGYFTYQGFNAYPWDHVGMTSRHGNPTKHYYKIQKINKELLFIDEYILNAAFVGYIQTGVTPSGEVPIEQDRIKKFGLLKSLPDANLFVGCFDYYRDDKRYNMYYIVNNDLVNEVHANMTFKKSINYTMLHRTNKFVAKSEQVALDLTPGDACIVIEELK